MTTYGDNAGTGKKLRGDLLFTVYGPGWAYLGMEDPVNVTDFELDPGSGTIETHAGAGVENEGQALAAWVDEGTPKITLSYNSLPVGRLSDVMRGVLGLSTQSAGSVTDEPITLIEGKWVRLPMQQLVEGTEVLTGVGGTPVHTADDFEVQHRHGLIKALTPAAAGPQEMDFDHLGFSRNTITGPSKRQAQVGLSLFGENKTTGGIVEFTAEKCLMVYTAKLTFVGGKEVVSVSAEAVPIGTYDYEEWS